MNTTPSTVSQSPNRSTANILPGFLAKLGRLETRWQQHSFSGDREYLQRAIAEEVSQILQHAKNWKGPSTKWQQQVHVLCSSFDPVLRYALAHHAGLSASTNLFQAEQAYLKAAGSYDQILGDFLPQNLLEKGWQKACDDFREDASETASDDWRVYGHNLLHPDERQSNLIGSTTGLARLDTALGGLHGLTFLAGDKGVGKTTLAIAMAEAALQADPQLCVLFCSLDMPKHIIYNRLVCRRAQITYRDFISRNAEVGTQNLIRTANDSLKREVLPRLKVRHICVANQDDDFAEIVRRDLRALRKCTGAVRDLVVIDSFRRVPIPSYADPSVDHDVSRIDLLERILCAGRAVLIVAEIRKTDVTFREPVLDDLRGSSSLGYTADNVLLMWQPPEQGDAEIVRVMLRIAKGRDGVIRRDVPLLFDHTHYQFMEEQSAVNPARANTKNRSADPLAGRRGGSKLE